MKFLQYIPFKYNLQEGRTAVLKQTNREFQATMLPNVGRENRVQKYQILCEI
jgi:hypothetical protein